MTEEDQASPEKSTFNGSIQTLIRVDALYRACQSYAVNQDVVGFRNNLFEIFKEVNGLLTKEEKKTAYNKWFGLKGINTYKIHRDEDENLVYDSHLFDLLHEFDFWIKNKMIEHNFTIQRTKDGLFGFDKLMTRYGIK